MAGGQSGTRLYLTSLSPSYVPAQTRGSWYLPPQQRVRLSPNKAGSASGVIRQEANSSVVTLGLVWAISEPFTTVSLPSGTRIDWQLDIAEQAADADLYSHVHVYVLVGSTNTVRCTLLNNYESSATSPNEWPITAQPKGPELPPTLGTCGSATPRVGDRLVVEFGYVARNRSSSPRYGVVSYGSTGPDAGPGISGGAPWINLIGASISF